MGSYVLGIRDKEVERLVIDELVECNFVGIRYTYYMHDDSYKFCCDDGYSFCIIDGDFIVDGLVNDIGRIREFFDNIKRDDGRCDSCRQ